MWWARSSRFEVYLSPSLVGCAAVADAPARWHAVASVEQGLGQLRHWLDEAQTPVRLRVWLASTLARPLMLAPDCGARDGREAAALATMAAKDVLAVAGEPKVWCAPWRPGKAALAVAIAGHLWTQLEALDAVRGSKKLHVESVRPWWNQVLDDVLARSRADKQTIGWSVGESDGLVVGRAREGRLSELGFEASKRHDPNWALLRRRLGASWHDVDALHHVDFAQSGPPGDAAAVGVARTLAPPGAGA